MGQGRICRSKTGSDKGYTLVEVLITVFVMGLILLIVNIIIVSLVRVSFDTDTRIQVRQGLDFALEVVRRNIKSGEPGYTCLVQNPVEDARDDFPNAIYLQMAEGSRAVVFFVRRDEETESGVLTARWSDGATSSDVMLTSPHEVTLTEYDVVVTPNPDTGTAEVIITLTASSVHRGATGNPLVSGVTKQEIILTRHAEL
ncbi:MAG: prepilin-type N-terminal cleavage/methylation domain-containing protein [Candidatus Dojkabacteria bacterium]|nr:prepilin-type N-terminal cleavage/methylation domain-containing protein [Candidatus Dojkabacteria bacterium]